MGTALAGRISNSVRRLVQAEGLEDLALFEHQVPVAELALPVMLLDDESGQWSAIGYFIQSPRCLSMMCQ